MYCRSGGYKISALHVERLLLAHPDIKDIAVVGIDDKVYGQKVAAVIVQDGATSSSDPISAAKVIIFFHIDFTSFFQCFKKHTLHNNTHICLLL